MKFLRNWEDAEPAERILSIITFVISTIIITLIILNTCGIIRFPMKYYIPLITIFMIVDGINAWKRSKVIAIFYFILTFLFFMIYYLNMR